MDTFKKAVSTLKDRIVKSPLERSVYDACSDENWGSSNSVLHEISEKTFNHEDRQIILKCIWDLLKSPPKEWRRLYKVLNLIEHLLKFGSTGCLHEIQDEAFKIRMLQDFSFREGSEEKGTGVRDKAKYLSGMLNDRNTLDEEREKAKKIWNKFTGISSDNTYARDGWKSSYDPYIEKKYDSGEVKDIFKESEVKVQKLETKESVWDKEPGRLPAAPRVIRPPPSGNGGGNIFEPVAVKKVSERADDGMFVGMNPGRGSGGVLPGQAAGVSPNAGYGGFGGGTGNSLGSSRSVPAFNDQGVYPHPGNEFINVGGPNKASFPSSTGSHLNTPALFTNPSPNPSASYTSHSQVNPAPSYVNPTPLYTNPGPSYTNHAPSFPNPAPSFTNPNPLQSFVNPSPSYTNPAPVFTNPAPVYTNPAPVFTNPAPVYTNPAPTYMNPSPMYTNPTPSYTNPAPSFTNPNPYTNPSYQNTANLSGLGGNNPVNYAGSTNPNPGYSNYGNNSLIGLSLGRSDNLPSASYANPHPEPKVHANLVSGSGLTMEDMKKFGNAGFTNFQSAPVEPVKINLEQKLMNLDDLEAGQPRVKEIAKSRW